MYIIPYFINIEAQVIDQIGRAQQSIYIAVAWFTNPRIMNTLIQRVETRPGISIQIVMGDNETNQQRVMFCSYNFTGKANANAENFSMVDDVERKIPSYVTK